MSGWIEEMEREQRHDDAFFATVLTLVSIACLVCLGILMFNSPWLFFGLAGAAALLAGVYSGWFWWFGRTR